MVKTVTAYFAFSNDFRASVRQDLEAAAEEGTKVSVARVAKGLGHKWAELREDEKERWKVVAKKRTEALAEAEANAAEEGYASIDGIGEQETGSGRGGNVGSSGHASASKPAGFPASIVKRIMCFDEEVDRISGGALKAVSKAAELFLSQMAERSMAVAVKAKRKTLKFSDIQQSSRNDKRMAEMGLQDILAFSTVFSEARGDGGDADGRSSKKAKLDFERDTKLQTISGFFAAVPAVATTEVKAIANSDTESETTQ